MLGEGPAESRRLLTLLSNCCVGGKDERSRVSASRAAHRYFHHLETRRGVVAGGGGGGALMFCGVSKQRPHLGKLARRESSSEVAAVALAAHQQGSQLDGEARQQRRSNIRKVAKQNLLYAVCNIWPDS